MVYLGIIWGKEKHHTNNVYLYNLNNSNFVLTSKLSTIKKLLKINIKIDFKETGSDQKQDQKGISIKRSPIPGEGRDLSSSTRGTPLKI